VRMCVSLAKQDGVLLGAEELRRQVGDAIRTLADELKGRRGSKTRLDAANSILDRVGLDVKQTVRQQTELSGSVQLSAADVIAALQAADKARNGAG
jgi:hypothetical protein